MTDEITTSQAAELLGMERSHVRKLCASGALEARKMGRDWLIQVSSITEYEGRKKLPGRPRAGAKMD